MEEFERVVLDEAIVVANTIQRQTRKWEVYPYVIRKCGIFIIKFLGTRCVKHKKSLDKCQFGHPTQTYI